MEYVLNVKVLVDEKEIEHVSLKMSLTKQFVRGDNCNLTPLGWYNEKENDISWRENVTSWMFNTLVFWQVCNYFVASFNSI